METQTQVHLVSLTLMMFTNFPQLSSDMRTPNEENDANMLKETFHAITIRLMP
jgi:hypothetical protein